MRILKPVSVIVLFAVAFESYLIIKQEYLIATLLLIFILGLWFLASFVLNKQIASLFFEKEIMNYMKKNNGQATIDQLFEYFDDQAGKQGNMSTLEIISYSIEKLQNKKKVILEGNRLIKCI